MSDEQYVIKPDAKWVCNAMPKHGLHKLMLMVYPVAEWVPDLGVGPFRSSWVGTFKGNSFTELEIGRRFVCYQLGRLPPSKCIKGHIAYDEKVSEWMDLAGFVHVFVYRDLRDVAVSQAWHIIETDQERLAHPGVELYPRDDFDKVLELVIEGIDIYTGIIERWSHFAKWVKAPWVLAVKYEDLMANPEDCAKRIFEYGLRRNSEIYDMKIGVEPDHQQEIIKRMADFSFRTDLSQTYRKGQPGEWRECFTDRHIALWKKHDWMRWLYELDYEDKSWYE